MKKCHKCGLEFDEKYKPGFNDACEKCASYVHVCKNCRLYDEFAPGGCKSPTTEQVKDPEGQNYCDEFELRDEKEDSGREERTKQARDALDNLFGGKEKK